jgi:hypothetical protein
MVSANVTYLYLLKTKQEVEKAPKNMELYRLSRHFADFCRLPDCRVRYGFAVRVTSVKSRITLDPSRELEVHVGSKVSVNFL